MSRSADPLPSSEAGTDRGRLEGGRAQAATWCCVIPRKHGKDHLETLQGLNQQTDNSDLVTNEHALLKDGHVKCQPVGPNEAPGQTHGLQEGRVSPDRETGTRQDTE